MSAQASGELALACTLARALFPPHHLATASLLVNVCWQASPYKHNTHTQTHTLQITVWLRVG